MTKSWKNESKHSSFESADDRRNELLAKGTEGFEVKEKFLNSESRFVVKTWNPSTEKNSSKGQKEVSQGKSKPKTRAGRRAEKMKRKAQQKKSL